MHWLSKEKAKLKTIRLLLEPDGLLTKAPKSRLPRSAYSSSKNCFSPSLTTWRDKHHVAIYI